MPSSREANPSNTAWCVSAPAAFWQVLGLIAVIVAPGCRPPTGPEITDAVAWVEGVPIRHAELEAEIQRRPPAQPSLSDAELRDSVLADLIRHRALLHRARTEGLDQDPETRRRIERLIASIYLEKHRPDPDQIPTPTDEEIRQSYDQKRAEFATPERIRVGLIHLRGSPKASTEKAHELRQTAERLRADLDPTAGGTALFADLARQHSDDRTSRYQGGDIGWVELGRKNPPWPEPVVQAMSRLQSAGDLSPVIETPSGCYLLKLLAREGVGVRPLEAVRDEVIHRLQVARKAALTERFENDLKAGLQVQVVPDAVARVEVPPRRLANSTPQPPALPHR